MKNKNQKNYRQGDVLLIPISTIPSGKTKTRKCTLALGEATGHHHTILDGAIGYADDEISTAEYITVEKALAKLEHQEHATIDLPRGNYQVIIQSEYTPEAIKKVSD